MIYNPLFLIQMAHRYYSDDLYSFESFIPQGQSRSADASLWALRFGFNYNF